MSSLALHSLAAASPSDKCQWKFDHYSPSSWETYWYDNISTLQSSVCPTLMQKDQLQKSIAALEYIINLQKAVSNQSSTNTMNQGNELLSKMYYRYECSDSFQSTRIVSQEIEPLIGLLRDPLTICPHQNLPPALRMDGENAVQSKRFFLLGPSAPYLNFSSLATPIVPWLYKEGSQKILFDLGSSYFNGVEEKTASSLIGTRWFYEYFRLHSLCFDRIIAFEAREYKPQAYWNQIPDDVMGLLTFINRGVETTGKFNPWNILKSIAKVDDYVIIKLDIDTPTLEIDLINQVLNDASISSLIDEMFFEMHVTVNEMVRFWGRVRGELKDSYVVFRKLRETGIRMHSWP